RQKQILPITLDEAWTFFSNPHQLPELTPAWMHMQIKSSLEKEMYIGMLMVYQIKPLFGIQLKWVTEITHIEEKAYFIDEQRFGPYRFWHHEHHFKAVEQGVEMIDKLHYALPFGYLGNVVHQVSVKNKIEKVFNFRRQMLTQKFGEVN